jgi:polysaccharide biosynthesis protein VpsM
MVCKWNAVIITALAISINNNALAYEIGDAAGIPLGAGHLYPKLETKLIHDDNLFRLNTVERDTWIAVFSPELTYELKSNKSLFLMHYDFEAGEHFSSHDDDYTDHIARIEYEYQPTSRIFTAVRGEFVDTRDPRGTGASEGAAVVVTEPDAYHTFGILGEAGYGSEQAKARFEVDMGYKTKQYDNNRATTFVRDRDDFYGSGRFYYRIKPKTNAVLEFRATNFNYDRDAVGTPGLDSTLFKYLAGVTWDATFKTTGYAKIGWIDKQFDSSARQDDDDVLWEFGTEWRPRTYSTFNLSTQRDYTETNGTGDFIQEDTIDFSWVHQWRERISSYVNFTYGQDDYTTAREDDRYLAGVGVNYDMRRWVKLGAGYTYDERDSNVNTFDYDRNLFELTALLTF